MRPRHVCLPLVVGGMILASAGDAPAQQASIATPQHAVGDSFFEQTGTNWGFNWKGTSFRFGGPGQAAPGFGNFDPNAGANLGFAVQGNGFNGFFNGTWSQGSRQSFTSQVPSMTLINGQPGIVSDTTLSPFVIGFVPVVGGSPVVGGFPTVGAVNLFGLPATSVQLPTFSMFGVNTTVSVPDRGSALLGGVDRAASGQKELGAPGLPKNRALGAERGAAGTRVDVTIHDLGGMDAMLLSGAGGELAPSADAKPDAARQALVSAGLSSAGQAVPSLADARRSHEAEKAAQDEDAMRWFQRGRSAEQQGKASVAKTYYQMAARRASGDLKASILAKLEALRAASPVTGLVQQDVPQP